ncbi:YveK family protein [Fructobacillus evanidus]|uniref:Capsular polysaccharide biosynthesis protein CpsC n=1 Tax=Fructobacillus evanidus TaxID=3064281 RepID=A0ABN9YHS1_9LACO|nr:Capsular polysaccharide biosynthesis protein YveK (YveK) [Fructobacillus sp. LMG 32999]CAK1223703.1 Capsular polysaccharide biosynthesis protein YveK (YveK) [Fructobacillus sp. LMG 32999]CAK1223783.1 Capsular polysaccharide biosynthesis protein YveK (YveK) [Fructobacillus sp. LMG 32999]CAK1230890.1 Capsular polysaccharide biosynthesis protein YveK (YveK) [Fructobacillus sp. LMG 32999]CAK1250725.1 Capsular polysaccharide biosynthesis protein YveK (YveK) [Fructobacillus sp. LMG 32999]
MSESKELEQIWYVMKRRSWWIILLTIIGLTIGFGFSSYFVKPSFTSTTTLLVDDKNKTSSDKQQDINLITTYKDLIVSTDVLKPVTEDVDSNLSVPTIRSMVSVTTNSGSQVFAINVKSKSANQSTEVANAIAKEFQNKLSSMMNMNNVSIIDRAQSDNQVESSKSTFYILVFGAVLGGGSFVYFWMQEMSKREKKHIETSRVSRLK